LGKGSSFMFTLELTLTEAAAAPDTEELEVPDLGTCRILLAEDIAVNRIVLGELLSITHVAIEEAVDGQEAVDMFARSPLHYYDLIFMDVQMPRKDGYEAAREIRALDRPDARTIPIIAMTANAYREDVASALDAGMDAHIAKPIDINIVLATLTETLCNSIPQQATD
jgi:Response regulators consisting of a CheY-like receiver domain and a winged-helix DNA-binding domain